MSHTVTTAASAVELLGPTPRLDSFWRILYIAGALVLVSLSLLIPWTWLRVIGLAVTGLVLLLVLALSVSSWLGDIRRARHAGEVGVTLPELSLIKRDVDRPTWLLFSAIMLDGNRTFLGAADGSVSDWAAANGIERDNIVVVNYPQYGLDENTAFPYILQFLTDNGLTGRLIVVGLSYGGQPGDRFHDWYNSQPVDKRRRQDIAGLVFISVLPGRSQVKDAVQRGLMVALRPFSGGPAMDSGWDAGLWTVFAPLDPVAQQHMQDAGRGELFGVMREGQHEFGASRFMANSARIVDSRAFRSDPVGAECPVIIINFEPDGDNVINVEESVRIIKSKYPRATETPRLRAGGHGQLFEYGPDYAKVLWMASGLIPATHRR